MSEPGVRPGGLTALAVINFVWAAFELIRGGFGIALPVTMPALIGVAEEAASRQTETRAREKALKDLEQAREANEVIQSHRGLVTLTGSLKLLLGALLILSGIGYLKLRRFLGWKLGLAYAAIAVLGELGVILYIQKEMGESLGILSLISFIYPAITIFALLVTFRDDFTNP